MKFKHMTIITLALMMVFAFSTQVLAEGSGNVDFGGGSTYDLSNKVWIEYTNDDSTNAQEFGVGTVHSAGDREYTTTEATSVIWWRTVTKGTTTVTATKPGWTTGQYEATSDWSSL